MPLPKENLEHHCFAQPDDPTERVWRYIDFPKLVWALARRELLLTRLNTLDDQREGRHGKHRRALVIASLTRQLEQTGAIGGKESSAEHEKMANQYADQLEENEERSRAGSFVSCWCKGGTKESEAMWQIYGRRDASVALVLPYERLRDSLSDPTLFIGAVNYFNYNTDIIASDNIYRATMYKGHEYEYEKEVRIVKHDHVVWGGDKTPDGVMNLKNVPPVISIPWVIADHVEKIVISPYAKPWQAEAIRAVVSSLSPGLEARLVQSEMS